MAADRTIVDFGSRLREARERRGISLRQIAAATKISVSFLEALERNDIARLPGGIFSRAFVRSYAAEVGLDPEEAIREFIGQFPHDSVTAGHPTAEPAEDHEDVDSKRRTATIFLRLALLSVPIAAGVAYFGFAGRMAAPGAQPTPPPVAAVVPEPLSLPASAPAPAADAEAAPAEAPSDRLTVTLAVSRASWLSATVDGQKAIERVLQPGDGRTIDVRHELVLRVGDAGAVAMTVNGSAAKPLGKPGEVVTVRVNPTNFKEFLPAP